MSEHRSPPTIDQVAAELFVSCETMRNWLPTGHNCCPPLMGEEFSLDWSIVERIRLAYPSRRLVCHAPQGRPFQPR